ncbi:MAG: glycosyltransferase [Ruminococcus sp.]
MISIIVPVYKIEDLLPECIESLINQTYKDIEIILVDDGSPDRCPEICDDYAKKDDRIKVIHKSNEGLVSARKAGLQIAKGEYIGYVDGDDWVEPEMYEELVNIISQYNPDIVAAGFKKDIGNTVSIKINSVKSGLYTKEDLKNYIIPNMLFIDGVNQPGIYTYVWNKVFKKSLLYDNQMNVDNDIFLGEDAACVYPTILNAESIYITDTCYYHYRQRADSMLKLNVGISKDISGIKLLYEYLNRIFVRSPYYSILFDGFNKYILYLLSSRSGGVLINNGVDLYLYENKKIGHRVCIYGAGTVGQHLYRRLKDFNIVRWVDPDYITLQEHGLSVTSPDSINDADFDSLIVAIMDKEYCKRIKDEMVDLGVEESKIILSDFNNVDVGGVLKKFGIIE